MDIKENITAKALESGFDVVQFTTPDAIPQAATRLKEFVAAGRHGDMKWMETTLTRRSSPQNLWPDVRSIIVLGMNYGPESDPLDCLKAKENGVISVYARGGDYHDLVKKRLKNIARWIHSHHGAEVKVFVDTAPVMEKPLAQAAGVGWMGKHTNLVTMSHGSWLFLGSIFTTLKIEPDKAEIDHCGSCTACLDICPTKAFPQPYQMDARRCISYLTIEYKGHIPVEFRTPMGNRIYGCDDCLAICPWNKFAKLGAETKLKARAEFNAPDLGHLMQLDDTAFRARFSGSPIKRTGRDSFIRNVLIAVGNSGSKQLAAKAENLLIDESPVVRASAIWALSRLLEKPDFARLKQNGASLERDSAVAAEWEG
jgi:epoxyqueuosine reductase